MLIAFIGYGEMGVQVYELLKQKYPALKPVYFDDELYKANIKNAHPFKDYIKDTFKNYSFVICLGYRHAALKNKIFKQLVKQDRKNLSFVHVTCFVSRSATIGAGSVLYPMCNIDKEVKIGNAVLLNNSVVISHNSSIGNSCYLSPGVVLSGNVTIGENTFLGTGVVVSNGITIGKNVVIGIGTVITKNIPDNAFVIGNPMKLVDQLEIK
jgi:sugar O-acyltransferase (sialic acid O-acetyltransferase NeuD family)